MLLVNKLGETTLIFRNAAQLVGAEITELETPEQAARSVGEVRYETIFVDPTVANFSRQGFTRLVRESTFNSQTPVVLISTPYAKTFVKFEADKNVSVMVKPSNEAELLPYLKDIRKKLLADRRRNPRLAYRTIVNCAQGGRRQKSASVNISSTGILLEINWITNRGDEMELHFQLGEDQRVFHCLSRVVRFESPGRVAMEFQNLGRAERELLRNFIDAHLPALR